MKQVRIIKKLMAVVTVLALGSCSSEELLEVENQNDKQIVKMELVGKVIGFDQQGSSKTKVQTRTTGSSWKDGDKIYITFYNGSNIIPGEASYSSTSGWSVSYAGNLATGSNLKCEARYFVNATSTNPSFVSLNSNSEIYEDLNAKYAYSNGSLTVTAILSPKTGRIRFIGKPEEKIHTKGISVYTTFSPEINAFTTSDAMITSTVASNGSTPYIYGSFTDDDRNLGLISSDYAGTRTCASNILNVGESGYMAIPSDSSHNYWRNGVYFKASGVEFKMLPVAGHSDGFFLMAETETTEALYNSVYENASTSQLPKDYISYPSVNTFIEKLNNETKLNFSLPSAEQWLYAAKGGDKSQGYTYAGSNIPGDVAWYSANSSKINIVKTKAPNELGIYDMSGNVGEFVSTLTTENSSPYIYGGKFNLKASDITNTSYYEAGYGHTSTMAYSGVGFRLILTFK